MYQASSGPGEELTQIYNFHNYTSIFCCDEQPVSRLNGPLQLSSGGGSDELQCRPSSCIRGPWSIPSCHCSIDVLLLQEVAPS